MDLESDRLDVVSERDLAKLRHSMDADDPQISEQISEKIPAGVAVPRYLDPWHPDPLDADMTLATLNIHRCSIYFSLCIIPHV